MFIALIILYIFVSHPVLSLCYCCAFCSTSETHVCAHNMSTWHGRGSGYKLGRGTRDLSCSCLQVYSSGSDVKQRGLHVVVLNQGNVSTGAPQSDDKGALMSQQMVVVFVFVLLCIGDGGSDLEKQVVFGSGRWLPWLTVGLAEMDNTVFIAASTTSSSEQIEPICGNTLKRLWEG